MKPTNTKPPRRLREREGGSRPSTDTLNRRATESKPFDAVEQKLSLAFDALLDAIDTYRETRR